MKQIGILAVVLLLQLSATAQQGFVMSGSHTQNSNGSASSSMGQICQNTDSNASGTFQEGLQHPYEYANVVSVEELFSATEFSVFPNPARDFLLITHEGQDHSPVQLRLFDTAGKLIREDTITSNQHTLSLQNLRPGIYYLRLHMNNQTNTIEIVKQ